MQLERRAICWRVFDARMDLERWIVSLDVIPRGADCIMCLIIEPSVEHRDSIHENTGTQIGTATNREWFENGIDG